ncbi:MAG: TlpA family protein disulfide reductase [Myxococcales bacterium]|nr:TlpA family protein disulfide reductase [Myxococcales bacterium]
MTDGEGAVPQGPDANGGPPRSVRAWLRHHWPAVLLPVLILAGALLGSPGRDRTTLVGEEAPPLVGPLVSGSGALFELEAYRGRMVLLEFWASWCTPCRRSAPVLNAVQGALGEEVSLVGVNVETRLPPATVEAAHRLFGYRFPSMQDTGGRAMADYGIQNLPTIVLIDREGVLRLRHEGVPEEGALLAEIRRHLR